MKKSIIKTGILATALAISPLANAQDTSIQTVDVSTKIVVNGTPYLTHDKVGHITSIHNVNQSKNPVLSRVIPNRISIGASFTCEKNRIFDNVHNTGVDNKGILADRLIPKIVILSGTMDFNNKNKGWISAMPFWKTELPIETNTMGKKLAKTVFPSSVAWLTGLADRENFNSLYPSWDITTLTKGNESKGAKITSRLLPESVATYVSMNKESMGKLTTLTGSWNTSFPNAKTKLGKFVNAITPDRVDLYWHTNRDKKFGADFVYKINK